MGRCPVCRQTVPAAEERCEFCGTSLLAGGSERPSAVHPSALWFASRKIGSADPVPTVDPLSDSVPDRIPEDLLEHYGEEARQTVRHRRSVRYRWGTWTKPAARALRSGDLWLMTLMLFGCGVIAFAFIGAIVYAVMLAPWVGLYVVLPLVVLFVASLFVSIRLVRGHPGAEPGS